MKQFLYIIHKSRQTPALSAEKQKEFLKSCEEYIKRLTEVGKMISAQPLKLEGTVVSKKWDIFVETPLWNPNEYIGGYYHIYANSLEEAALITTENPEFTFFPSTRIEVRPIQTVEESTGYEYPCN